MKVSSAIGLAGGIVLLLSSLAHAFLGWPAIGGALRESAVDTALIGAISVGWYFGSVAMAVFGVIVCMVAWRRFRGVRVSTAPALVIAAAYLVFGTCAFVSRGYNPHFLLFVATGLLVGALSFTRF